jgi:hypothetical protein
MPTTTTTIETLQAPLAATLPLSPKTLAVLADAARFGGCSMTDIVAGLVEEWAGELDAGE